MKTYPTLRAANMARQEEWAGDRKLPLSYAGNELAGETGEACNIIKKIERARHGMVGSRATVEQLAEELADIVICVDLIAMEFDLDLAEWIESKFNATSKKYGLQTRIKHVRRSVPDIF